MSYKVEVGYKFKLGAWNWRVISVSPSGDFEAARIYAGGNMYVGDGMRWNAEDALKLEWIKPDVSFTKDQAEAIKIQLKSFPPGSPSWHETYDTACAWLDEHTKK